MLSVLAITGALTLVAVFVQGYHPSLKTAGSILPA